MNALVADGFVRRPRMNPLEANAFVRRLRVNPRVPGAFLTGSLVNTLAGTGTSFRSRRLNRLVLDAFRRPALNTIVFAALAGRAPRGGRHAVERHPMQERGNRRERGGDQAAEPRTGVAV